MRSLLQLILRLRWTKRCVSTSVRHSKELFIEFLFRVEWLVDPDLLGQQMRTWPLTDYHTWQAGKNCAALHQFVPSHEVDRYRHLSLTVSSKTVMPFSQRELRRCFEFHARLRQPGLIPVLPLPRTVYRH
jgi:hypothetical protein